MMLAPHLRHSNVCGMVLLLSLMWLEIEYLAGGDEVELVATSDFTHHYGGAVVVEPPFNCFVGVVAFDVGECAALGGGGDWCIHGLCLDEVE
jgi:hypothetical protein